jgi:hypothetical protein
MEDGARNRRSARAPSRAVLAIWAALGLHVLTYCAGKSNEEDDASTGGTTSGTSNGGNAGVSSGGVSSGGVSSGGVSSGGVSSGGVSSGGTNTGGVSTGGFAGHTGQCIGNPCAPGCGFCAGAGQGGVSGDGNGGQTTGGAGFAGTFAGHTSGCFANPCMCTGGCGAQGGQGGLSGGGNGGVSGNAGISGSAGVTGFAGHTGSGFAKLPSNEKPDTTALLPSVTRGCYVLGGFEGDPCLPADDTVLAWLDGRPSDCEPHVAAGPFTDHDGHVRKCCYSVTCETSGTRPTSDPLPGLR